MAKTKKRFSTATLSPDQITAILQAVWERALAIEPERFFVVDVTLEPQGSRWILSVFVELRQSERRINLDECAEFSRALSPEMDVLATRLSGLATLPYSLDVGSPGLYRQLTKQREFEFYAGKVVQITQKNHPPTQGVVDRIETDKAVVTLTNAEPGDESVFVYEWGAKGVDITLAPSVDLSDDALAEAEVSI